MKMKNSILFGICFFVLLNGYSEPQPRSTPRIFKDQGNAQNLMMPPATQSSSSSDNTNNTIRAQRLAAQLNAQTQATETDAQRLVRLQKERAEIVQSITQSQQRLNQSANHVHSEACAHGHSHSANNSLALQRMLQQRQADLAEIDQDIAALQK